MQDNAVPTLRRQEGSAGLYLLADLDSSNLRLSGVSALLESAGMGRLGSGIGLCSQVCWIHGIYVGTLSPDLFMPVSIFLDLM